MSELKVISAPISAVPVKVGVVLDVMSSLSDAPLSVAAVISGVLGAAGEDASMVTARAAEAGLTRVDHIAQTMSYDEMLSWSLFWTTLFDMEKAPMVDVVDPDGLIRSRAIAAPGGEVRITLNGAETHKTLAGSFLAEGLGATIQHVALATEDIFATAEALKAKGFEALPLSPNYFDDLAARFDLAPEMLEKMRAASILYDADEQGEFFQLYSKPFAGQMFFEIVERRGGYAGYGAPNAPFRIAALKRLQPPKGMPAIQKT